MSVQQDLLNKALEYFGIEGLGNVPYEDRDVWRRLARSYANRASSQLGRLVSSKDWESTTNEQLETTELTFARMVNDHHVAAWNWVRQNVFDARITNVDARSIKLMWMAAYWQALKAASFHEGGAWMDAIASGAATADEAWMSLNSAIGTLELITKFGELGYFEKLAEIYGESQGATQGLGAPPAIPIAVVVAGVVLVAVTAAAFLGFYYITVQTLAQKAYNDKILDECAKLAAAGNTKAYQVCMDKLSPPDPSKGFADAFDAFSSVIKPIGIIAALAGAAYLAVQFAPQIVRKLKQASTA